MSTEPSYARQVTSKAIATKLGELLPAIDTDWAVIADCIVDTCEISAMATIDHRENALQQAMVSTMTYYSGALRDMQERIAQLQSERADLVLKLAAVGGSGGQGKSSSPVQRTQVGAVPAASSPPAAAGGSEPT